jgi:hypothetical protein
MVTFQAVRVKEPATGNGVNYKMETLIAQNKQQVTFQEFW